MKTLILFSPDKISVIELLKAQMCVVLYLLPFIIGLVLLIVWYGKRCLKQEQEYEAEYEKQDFMITHMSMFTTDLHTEVVKQFELLSKLPWKNPEKTEVLYNKYLIKCSEIGVRPRTIKLV